MRYRRLLAPAIVALALLLPGTTGSTRAAGTATTTTVPTATATPTATSTPRPTASPQPERPRPTPTPTATSTPTPTRVVAVATPRPAREEHHVRRPTSTPTAIPTSTPTHHPAPRRQLRKHHLHRKHKRHRPKGTATPVPTPTPDLNLQADNTIAPITCNGPGKPVAQRPFLTPPYHGWTSIVSYFDHDMPDYLQDGLVVTATGLEARLDPSHVAADFPAYWSAHLRQYLYYDGHNGYDYDLSYVPVYAAARGTVIFAHMEYPTAPQHGYGNMVMIDHHNGYVTLYGHFSQILVHDGEKVKRGQQIGVSGNTGHSSGPHLHFTVFHNCSPVDPYGWVGPGTDPLESYQGEYSTYLWRRAPLVTNPLAGFPGIDRLAGYDGYRLLLLRLPSTQLGTADFTRTLRAEARTVERALGPGVRARIDLLRGAIVLDAPVPPARLFAIPAIVSIGSRDAAAEARNDLLAALARASLAIPHSSLPLGHSHDWRGYLLEWQGHTLLVGRGKKGQAIDLKVGRGGTDTVKTIQADATTGAYAVDLGKLSRSQRSVVRRQLEATIPRVHPIRNRFRIVHVPAARSTTSRRSTTPGPLLALALVVLLLLAASAATFFARRGYFPGRRGV